jgi:hypothetical protein
VIAEVGEVCDVRCSSAPSSVLVIGVGISLEGGSMWVPAGLVCASNDGCACAEGSCGGGVGNCIGTSMLDSPLLAALNSGGSFRSCAAVVYSSSGGQVARDVVLSCSTGEAIASSGVGMVRWSGKRLSQSARRLVTHGTKGRK